jgi:glycerate 2-kinase
VGFGLLAWGATTTSARRIAALTGLDHRVPSADVIVTGEGRFDRTSLTGKLVGSVLDVSARAGIPAFVVAGQIGNACPVPVISLTDLAGSSPAAVADPLRWLRAAGALAAQRF